MTACEDVLAPLESVPLSDLLILALQSGAPAAPTDSRWIRAGEPTTQVISLQHADDFNTLFAEVRFPSGSLRALNGTPLTSSDSVLVTVQPMAGRYGVTLSPSGLEFSGTAAPTVRFAYGRYGDFTVADGSPTYADPTDYAAALDVWREATLSRWQVAAASGPTGTDAIGASVGAPGGFLVAAPR